MRLRILTILTLLSVTLMARVPEQGKHVYRASTPEVTYVGRVVRDSAHVSFDWSGTYLRIAFYGRLLKIDYADTGSNWYNLWIDRPMTEKPDRVFRLSTLDEGETMGVYTLFRGEEYAEHEIILQKRTEGEQGMLTLYAFQVDGMLHQAEPVRERFIEFIGDSYTCGYGVDAASNKEHFKPRTENAGRTYAAIDKARIVLWIIDEEPSDEEVNELLKHTENKKLIVVRNKSDKTNNNSCNLLNMPLVAISAKYGTGIEDLEKAIYEAADIPALTDNDIIVTNARHYDALTRSRDCIQRVIDGLQMQLSGDLLSEDLRQALDTLSEITGGQITPNEVLGNIFKNFCVGK